MIVFGQDLTSVTPCRERVVGFDFEPTNQGLHGQLVVIYALECIARDSRKLRLWSLDETSY